MSETALSNEQAAAEDQARYGVAGAESSDSTVVSLPAPRNRRRTGTEDVERAQQRTAYIDLTGARRIVGPGQPVPAGWVKAEDGEAAADLATRGSRTDNAFDNPRNGTGAGAEQGGRKPPGSSEDKGTKPGGGSGAPGGGQTTPPQPKTDAEQAQEAKGLHLNGDYDKSGVNKPDLESFITARGLDVPDKGSGRDDVVTKADLKAVLVEDDKRRAEVAAQA